MLIFALLNPSDSRKKILFRPTRLLFNHDQMFDKKTIQSYILMISILPKINTNEQNKNRKNRPIRTNSNEKYLEHNVVLRIKRKKIMSRRFFFFRQTLHPYFRTFRIKYYYG